MKLSEARILTNSALELLRPYADQIEVAGSIRRQKPEVKDAEIVLIPTDGNLRRFKVTVWSMVQRGIFAWSSYVDKNGTTTYRQGDKYYGLDFRGLRVEVFLAQPDNWGYIHWLRTGPGDANQYIMGWLHATKAPYRARDGYWWAGEQMLATPTEADVFNLLGLPFIQPNERTPDLYQHFMQQINHCWGIPATIQSTGLQQKALF